MHRLPILTLAAALLLPWSLQQAEAREYMLVGTRPNQLHMVDLERREVIRTMEIPARAGNGPQVIVPSPDGRRAYVISDRWESVYGFDLDTGREVFRAHLSRDGERVKAPFGMSISPDGFELYVYEHPVFLAPNEYQVRDTRIAVFDTSDGLDSTPMRTFPAPRRVAQLFAGADGRHLYAMGWDIYTFDLASGELVDTVPVRHWERENYSEPDVLAVWPQYEQTGVFSTPYYAVRTDMDPEDPAAYKTGILTLDTADGAVGYQDVEDTEVVIFSSVINPQNPSQLFAVYTQLSEFELGDGQGRLVRRIELPHTYYAINISGDGRELYVGGAMNDIGIYSTETLERIGEIRLPGGGDQALTSLRIVDR